MPQRRILPLTWPAAGLDRRYALQQQPPYSTPSALNVWTNAQGRDRGGSRPGVAAIIDEVIANAPINLLTDVTFEDPVEGPTTYLVASSGGQLKYGNGGVLAAADPNTDEELHSELQLSAAEHLQLLYIADHDISEAASEGLRRPKVFDPTDGTLAYWPPLVTDGTMPLGCPLIATWRDRVLLAGGVIEPNELFGSRQGDPYDWDYSASDESGAFALSTTRAGRIGDRITAIAPFADNCVIIGCQTSLWILRGDPRSGGMVANLSTEVGVVGPHAWCQTPDGNFVFLSQRGLWFTPSACSAASNPQPLSQARIPEELVGTDTSLGASGQAASLAYDGRHGGIYVFVSSRSRTPEENSGYGAGDTHWFFHWESKSFWPMRFGKEEGARFDPFTTHHRRNYASTKSTIIFGCRDGWIRRMDTDAKADGHSGQELEEEISEPFPSHVVLGPFTDAALFFDTRWDQIRGAMATVSGKVTWSIYSGRTAEEAAAKAEDGASPAAKGYFDSSASTWHYPRVRGAALYLRLEATAPWAFEALTAVMTKCGKMRLQL